jgi:integrase
VFTNTNGGAMDSHRVRRLFKKALTRAKLPPQRFHDLRHAAASLLLAQGVDPRVVMEVLGHSQISLTLNTHSHVMPELQQDAAKLMDALLTRQEEDASETVQSAENSA